MSFSNTLNRLREAAKGQRGRKGDVLVSAFDLRDLLNDYDRIDTKYRALNEHRETDYKAQVEELLETLKCIRTAICLSGYNTQATHVLNMLNEAIAKASASTEVKP